MVNPLNFLQLTPENIAQAKGMSWGQALKTEIPGTSTYRGFNPAYKGAGATGLGGYIKSGLQSLTGNVPASGGVGGATPLTRKLALTAMNYGPKISRIANPIGAAMLGAEGGAKLGDWAYKNWEPATKFGDWAGGGIYDFLNPEETSIDPTGKNLFTQYHEDDPYAGIEGQTAMLGLPQLFGMITKGGFSKQAIKKALIKDQILRQIGKKTKPFIKRKIREKLGEKFGGTGKFKTIATGTKDYGPHTKTKTKVITQPSPHGGGGGSKGTHSTQGGGGGGHKAPGGGGYGPHSGGRNPWGRADGGLINFYRYGGFI